MGLQHQWLAPNEVPQIGACRDLTSKDAVVNVVQRAAGFSLRAMTTLEQVDKGDL